MTFFILKQFIMPRGRKNIISHYILILTDWRVAGNYYTGQDKKKQLKGLGHNQPISVLRSLFFPKSSVSLYFLHVAPVHLQNIASMSYPIL